MTKLIWKRLVVRSGALLCAASTVLFALAFVDPHWIESLFEVSPDGSSGEAEWGLVVAFGIVAFVSGTLTWVGHRRWLAPPSIGVSGLPDPGGRS